MNQTSSTTTQLILATTFSLQSLHITNACTAGTVTTEIQGKKLTPNHKIREWMFWFYDLQFTARLMGTDSFLINIDYERKAARALLYAAPFPEQFYIRYMQHAPKGVMSYSPRTKI